MTFIDAYKSLTKNKDDETFMSILDTNYIKTKIVSEMMQSCEKMVSSYFETNHNKLSLTVTIIPNKERYIDKIIDSIYDVPREEYINIEHEILDNKISLKLSCEYTERQICKAKYLGEF